jgi:D-serine deaminase-like pyridoxal phosphate-dependent protein
LSTDYERYRAALADVELPCAFVDLDAVDANLATLLGKTARDLPVRVATKSLRVPGLIRYLLSQGRGRLRGLMTFTAAETEALAAAGFDDLLLAYPIARPVEAARLASAATKTQVRVVVDAPAHLQLLSDAAQGAGVELGVCIEIDVGLRAPKLGHAVHLGVRRSPLRTPQQVLALAQQARELPGLTLDAVMAYEAQVAGVPDVGPSWRKSVLSAIKQRSIQQAAAQRAEVVRALRGAGFRIDVVNGGGSGSIDCTSADPVVTEVTAGSGFVCSHLFDGYDRLPLKPAVFFAIPVVRHPDPDHITCASGGYIASGPPGPDRAPIVHAPAGLTPIGMEGFGEVQTPMKRGPGAPPLDIGDPVICRHAKTGELAERFARYHLVRGREIVEVVPTWRGLGHTFP